MEAILGLSLFSAVDEVEGFHVKFSDMLCLNPDATPEPSAPLVADLIMATFAILGLFLFIGTVLDLYLQFGTYGSRLLSRDTVKTSLGLQLLLAFSLYTNLTAVMRTANPAPARGGDILTAVNGIRFISMTWVLMGHTFGFLPAAMGTDNTLTVKELISGGLGPASRALTNALPSVDTFFVLSGLLVGMGLFRAVLPDFV